MLQSVLRSRFERARPGASSWASLFAFGRLGRDSGVSAALVAAASLALAAVALASGVKPSNAPAAPSAPSPAVKIDAPAAPQTAAVQSPAEAMGYREVVFLAPRPMTVSETVRLRDRPSEAKDARVLGSVEPGDRIRITRVVGGAPEGPWLRLRLANGRDGYILAEHAADLVEWRDSRRAARSLELDAALAAAEVADDGVAEDWPTIGVPPSEISEDP